MRKIVLDIRYFLNSAKGKGKTIQPSLGDFSLTDMSKITF